MMQSCDRKGVFPAWKIRLREDWGLGFSLGPCQVGSFPLCAPMIDPEPYTPRLDLGMNQSPEALNS